MHFNAEQFQTHYLFIILSTAEYSRVSWASSLRKTPPCQNSLRQKFGKAPVRKDGATQSHCWFAMSPKHLSSDNNQTSSKHHDV